MFTGIIDHLGYILSVSDLETGCKMVIGTEFADVVLGESISVNGACLTVEAFSPGRFQVRLSSETLKTAAFAEIKEGTPVNLERALRIGDRLGGHWVTGHVDAVGRVAINELQGGFRYLEIRDIPLGMVKNLIPKGSVTVQGVSLTINQVFKEGFSVMLIPHTLERTNLWSLEKGSGVNLEFDILVKTVLHNLQQFLEAKS